MATTSKATNLIHVRFAFHIMTKISLSCLQDHFPRSEDTTCQIASKQSTILPVIELFHTLALWPQISVPVSWKKLVQFRAHFFYYNHRDKINFRSFFAVVKINAS